MADAFVGLVVLALRIGVLVALYLFIVQALRTLRAELATGAQPSRSGQAGSDLLEVITCDGVPGLEGRVYPLDNTSTIGRDPGSTIPIPGPRVSARHARLVWRAGSWWVEDLGSTNGTLLNGQAVTSLSRLSPADVLQVGPASLKVRGGAETNGRHAA